MLNKSLSDFSVRLQHLVGHPADVGVVARHVGQRLVVPDHFGLLHVERLQDHVGRGGVAEIAGDAFDDFHLKKRRTDASTIELMTMVKVRRGVFPGKNWPVHQRCCWCITKTVTGNSFLGESYNGTCLRAASGVNSLGNL